MNALVYFVLLASLIFDPIPDTRVPTHEEIAHRADFYCTALVVFSEARSESPRGQALVASTVRNRALSSRRYYCDVTNERGQYEGIERWPYPRAPWRIDPVAWTRAQAVTELVLLGWFDDECGNMALSFHVKQGHEHVLCIEGNHAFF